MNVKHILAVLMSVCLLATALPIGAVAAEATSAPQAALPSIEEQVRAYAKSIDQNGADEAAAWALATHGVTGRGKTLTVGADHSLTATLLNSNGGIATLVRGCEQAILYMHKLNLSCVFVDGGCCWYEESTYYTDTLYDPISGKVLKYPEYFYVTRFNNYDQSLFWMAGTTEIHQSITQQSVSANTITYTVVVSAVDRFDFNHSTSAPTEIMSLLGSALFRGFDWEATATFSLTVPNPCAHDGGYVDSITSATCTKDGGVTHTCRLCGYAEFEKTANKLAHDFGAWYVTKEPTCSAAGEEKRTCTRCKKSESRPIAKTEHNLVSYGGQFPTCTEAGWKSYEACTDCDYTTYTTLPPTAHTYTATVTPPTCDKPGYTTYTCADCGDMYIGNHVAAAGHQYESVTTPPTCTMGGYTTHTCTLCGYTYEEFYSSANPHQYQCTVTPPTCGDTGYLVYTCVCGDQFTTAFGTATGRHVYDGDRDPDCNTCGTVREVAAIPLGDVNGDGKVNNRDLGLLQQYINGWGTAIDPAAADVTADGKVNNRDLGLLQQYINGWGVELG